MASDELPTRVTATIRNPADPSRTREALALADTGAADCVVSRPALQAIGPTPRHRRVCELANGRKLKVGVTPRS